MIAEHFDAAVALLVADGLELVDPNAAPPADGVALYDGQIPKTPGYPYVHLSLRTSMDPLNLADQQTQFEGTLVVLHVAETAAALRIVQDRTRGVFLGVRPTVAGRNCWRFTRPASDPTAQDTDVTLPGSGLSPMFVRDYWRLASVPATA